jgi:hypothetical protein
MKQITFSFWLSPAYSSAMTQKLTENKDVFHVVLDWG